jgi:hypothetical protein
MKELCTYIGACIAYLALLHVAVYALHIVTLPLQFIESFLLGLLR